MIRGSVPGPRLGLCPLEALPPTPVIGLRSTRSPCKPQILNSCAAYGQLTAINGQHWFAVNSGGWHQAEQYKDLVGCVAQW